MLITSSCVLLAIIIISVGVCFYKKYGGSHYGSGQIRILSEDGSIEEEVMYVFQTNGKGMDSDHFRTALYSISSIETSLKLDQN